MKTIKLILKGILLYISILSAIILISDADCLYDNGLFFPIIIVTALLLYVCCNIITEKEFDTLSGYNIIKKISK